MKGRECPQHLGVSIHAPAKGATPPAIAVGWMLAVSIHAPAKGATRPLDCERADVIVSIHAPA